MHRPPAQDIPPEFAPDTARGGLRRGLLVIGAFLLAIAIGVLAVSRTDLGAQAVADLWRRSHPLTLLCAFAVMTLAFPFMALRWRALMPIPATAPTRPSPVGLTAIVCAGLLLNYALPGPMGELGAAWFASRRYKLPLASTLASGVAARLVGLTTAALTAALVWVLVDLPVPAAYHQIVGAAVLVIGIGGGVMAVLTARPEPWKRLAHALLGPLSRRPTRLGARLAKLDAAFGRTADGLAQVARARPRAWIEAVGWSAASHLSVIAGVALACKAFEATVNLPGLIFTYATTTAGAVVLFILPGSQLGWDAMFMSLLAGSAGLSLTDAAAITLVVRTHHLLLMAIGAAALAWLLRDAEEKTPEPPSTVAPPGD
ncbi:MAG: flippase-like domain-containing protein [Oligoflexia bacterium]|nr:flippase-like domain-containing protein [Oligoflexia bacterium]